MRIEKLGRNRIGLRHLSFGEEKVRFSRGKVFYRFKISYFVFGVVGEGEGCEVMEEEREEVQRYVKVLSFQDD